MSLPLPAALVTEMNSLVRRPVAKLTLERFFPEWVSRQAGGAIEYAHGHSAVVLSNGNGAGEDILFRARVLANGVLQVAAIKDADLASPATWESLYDDTAVTGLVQPNWVADDGADHGGSLAVVAGEDYFRVFCFHDNGNLSAYDFDLDGALIDGAVVVDTGDPDASMQLGACRPDEVFFLRYELVEGSLSEVQSNEDGTVIVVPTGHGPGDWQKDAYGTKIYRAYYDDGWQQDSNPFLFFTHAEGHLVKDHPDFDAPSTKVVEQWGFRPCGGLAVNEINADTVCVSIGMRFYYRASYFMHSQSLMGFLYHRDNGVWQRAYDNDEANFDTENMLWLDVFARGSSIDGRQVITWVRLNEPSEKVQKASSITIPRSLETVYCLLDQTGLNVTQFQNLSLPDDFASAHIVAINHAGVKKLFALAYTAILESPPASLLCDVPDADKINLDTWTNNFKATTNNRFTMQVNTQMVNARLRYETALKEGWLLRAYEGTNVTPTPIPALNLSFPFLVDEEGWELETDDLVGANPSWSLDWNAPGSTGGGLRSNADSAFFSEWRYPLNRQSSPGDTFQARVFGSSIGPGETNLATFYIKVIYDDETFEQEVIVEEFINWDLLELTLTQSKQVLYVALGVILNPEEFNSADLRYDDIVISMQEITVSPDNMIEVGMGYVDITSPAHALMGRTHNGPILSRAELQLLQTRAEVVEDIYPMQTLTIIPEHPASSAGDVSVLDENTGIQLDQSIPADVELKDAKRSAKWMLSPAKWPGLFFPGEYESYQDRLMFCNIGFPFAKTGGGPVDLPPGVEGGPGAVADNKKHRQGTFFNDIFWTVIPEPRIDGAIQATVRFGDNNNAPDGQEFEALSGCNVWARVFRDNGLITHIDWYSDDCGNPPGTQAGLPSGVWNRVHQESCAAFLICRSIAGRNDEESGTGKKYMFSWEANSNYGQSQSVGRGSHLGDQAFKWWKGTVHDRPDFRGHDIGQNRLYLFISDYNEENEDWVEDQEWTHAAVASMDAIGLTPGRPADMKLQVLGGTIHCFYRPVQTSGVRLHWRHAISHNSGFHGAGKFGAGGRGHAGIQWDVLKPGKKFMDKWEDRLDICDVEVTDCEQDKTLEDIIKLYAWRGLTETEFVDLVADPGPHVIEDDDYYAGYEATPLANLVIDFTIEVDTNGAEAGMFLRAANNEAPLEDCVILGLTFNNFYKNDADNVLLNFATIAEYKGGIETAAVRDYSPSAIHLKASTPYRVRISVRNDLFAIWVEGNYVGHFHNTSTEGTLWGFYAKDGTATISNIRIAELHEVPENAMLDPGQTMFDAIQRMVQGKHIKGVWRPYGKLKISRFRNHDEGPTLEDILEASTHTQTGRGYSVVQVHGAETYAIYPNHDLAKMGRKFIQYNNPDIMTTEQCFREAELLAREAAERTNEIMVSSPPHLGVEPEDEVTIVVAAQEINQAYLIDDKTISYDYIKKQSQMELSGRHKLGW